MAFELLSLDHVQVAIPLGGEERAIAFYSGILGLALIAKPAALAQRGGAWFQGPGFQIHVGPQEDFKPAKKAHPAFRVAGFDDLLARLEQAGIDFRSDREIPEILRGFMDDPFGNRIEVIAASPR
ncbi:MAG: VOC family protein [Actinobacteria bacterium]|nr:VOC family protein [Actinomycetota bacterium]